MQPLISDMTPLVSILNKIIRVLGSNTSNLIQKSQQNCCLWRGQNLAIQSSLSTVLRDPQHQTILKDQTIIQTATTQNFAMILKQYFNFSFNMITFFFKLSICPWASSRRDKREWFPAHCCIKCVKIRFLLRYSCHNWNRAAMWHWASNSSVLLKKKK